MFRSTVIKTLALVISSAMMVVAQDQEAGECTSDMRIANARLIPYSYNLAPLGASKEGFDQVRFAPKCSTGINPNGGPFVQVANTDDTTRLFAVETRQLFSEVTGEYTDFSNGTTVIHTNVTLGVRDLIPVPVTFYADVYLDYDLRWCEIKKVQAFAEIPTDILGIIINPPDAPVGLYPP